MVTTNTQARTLSNNPAPLSFGAYQINDKIIPVSALQQIFDANFYSTTQGNDFPNDFPVTSQAILSSQISSLFEGWVRTGIAVGKSPNSIYSESEYVQNHPEVNDYIRGRNITTTIPDNQLFNSAEEKWLYDGYQNGKWNLVTDSPYVLKVFLTSTIGAFKAKGYVKTLFVSSILSTGSTYIAGTTIIGNQKTSELQINANALSTDAVMIQKMNLVTIASYVASFSLDCTNYSNISMIKNYYSTQTLTLTSLSLNPSIILEGTTLDTTIAYSTAIPADSTFDLTLYNAQSGTTLKATSTNGAFATMSIHSNGVAKNILAVQTGSSAFASATTKTINIDGTAPVQITFPSDTAFNGITNVNATTPTSIVFASTAAANIGFTASFSAPGGNTLDLARTSALATIDSNSVTFTTAATGTYNTLKLTAAAAGTTTADVTTQYTGVNTLEIKNDPTTTNITPTLFSSTITNIVFDVTNTSTGSTLSALPSSFNVYIGAIGSQTGALAFTGIYNAANASSTLNYYIQGGTTSGAAQTITTTNISNLNISLPSTQTASSGITISTTTSDLTNVKITGGATGTGIVTLTNTTPTGLQTIDASGCSLGISATATATTTTLTGSSSGANTLNGAANTALLTMTGGSNNDTFDTAAGTTGVGIKITTNSGTDKITDTKITTGTLEITDFSNTDTYIMKATGILYRALAITGKISVTGTIAANTAGNSLSKVISAFTPFAASDANINLVKYTGAAITLDAVATTVAGMTLAAAPAPASAFTMPLLYKATTDGLVHLGFVKYGNSDTAPIAAADAVIFDGISDVNSSIFTDSSIQFA